MNSASTDDGLDPTQYTTADIAYFFSQRTKLDVQSDDRDIIAAAEKSFAPVPLAWTGDIDVIGSVPDPEWLGNRFVLYRILPGTMQIVRESVSARHVFTRAWGSATTWDYERYEYVNGGWEIVDRSLPVDRAAWGSCKEICKGAL